MANENKTDNARLLMYVIDVLRHDIEPVSSITKMLNNTGCIGWRKFWPHDFTEKEVLSALEQLMQEKMVKPLRYSKSIGGLTDVDPVNAQDLERCYFQLTDNGRRAWKEWEPPIEE